MIRLRETVGRGGSAKLLVLGVIALISLVVLWEHSAPGGHEMSDQGGMGAETAVGICLAVLQGGGVLLLGIGLLAAVRRARPSYAPARIPPAPVLVPRRLSPARPRAGPATLQVFLR